MSILVHDLALEIEGMADALHFSELFGEWWSIDNIDQSFGAKIDFFKQPCEGRNIFLHPPFTSISGKKIANRAIEKIKKDLIFETPTRVLLVIPRTLDRDDPYVKAHESNFLELARFGRNSIAFVRPDNFQHNSEITQKFDWEISLFLCVNKESLSRDPINWQNLVKNLRAWAETSNSMASLIIPEHTSNLFRERKPHDINPRAKSKVYPQGSSLFRFFNGIEPDYLHPIGTEFEGVYKKINKWPRAIGFLGLLPNPLRLEIKRITGDASAHKKLSKAIFFAGYQVWKARTKMIRQILKSAPLSFKKVDCKNPFHYLQRTANFSSAKMNSCSCSLKFVQKMKNLDLRAFFQPIQEKT